MAIAAVACHTNFRLNNLKAFGLSHIPLYISDQRTVKLNNFAATGTYQVVVRRGWLRLIVMMVFIKMDFLHQTQLFERLKASIYR